MRPLSAALAASVLAVALYAGARPVGPVPPLGSLLAPVRGVWSAAASATPPAAARMVIPGLRAAVEVRFDERGVPHVFARSEEDAFRALGYVVARDRLFQLEIQTRAAAGRLTELAGANPQVLALDRQARRLGMPDAAERRLASLPADGPSRRAVDAYADGVNAYIDGLTPGEEPFEYHLLGARPARWRPLDSLLLLERMSYTLAFLAPEQQRERAAGLVGPGAAAALFPEHTPLVDPIQPSAATPRLDAVPLPPPGAPDTSAAVGAALASAAGAPPDPDAAERFLASNNWAVSPARTAAGHALLAGDPHLELSLPSIWYEAHLVVPGRLDVYGVTIPGAPAIIIGFNRDVAWTETNTGADVLDFYRETVDDQSSPRHYLVDGAWRALRLRVERFVAPGGRVLQVDTVRYTHRGPLLRPGGTGPWLSMRWTALEPSDELAALHEAARARSAAELEDALARHWGAPAQNFLAADRGGHIAIRSTGRFPLRPDSGSGMMVRDGSRSASDWVGSWPVPQYPQGSDPARGYLFSANQDPLDPRAGRPYLGADPSYDPWRALRIDTLLASNPAMTPDAMRAMQTDRGSARADLFAPALLRAADVVRARAAGRGRAAASADLAALDSAARLLAGWDRRYTPEAAGPTLFEAAMAALPILTWDELSRGGAPVVTPSTAILAALLHDPASAWWDDRRTPEREDRDAILARALVEGFRLATEEHGPVSSGAWRWDRVQRVRIDHLLRVPALGAPRIPALGGRETLSPSSGDGRFGPSWRMVVELGPEVRAWGTYPGGQSGNPVSPRYQEHLATWSAGRLDTLRFPRAVGDLAGRALSAALTLTPGRR